MNVSAGGWLTEARIEGDVVYYRSIETQSGAVVQGLLVYQSEGKSSNVVPINAVPEDFTRDN